MKKLISIVLLASFCVILSGCVFSIGGGGHKHNKTEVCTKHLNSDPTIAEIHAVRRLMSDCSKAKIYEAIAQQPGLSPKARACLADEATKNLMSESAKAKILMTLAKNPPAPLPVTANVKKHSDTSVAGIQAVQ